MTRLATLALLLCAGCRGCAEDAADPTGPDGRVSTPPFPDRGPWIPADVERLPAGFVCAGDPPPQLCYVPVPGATFLMGAQATDPAGPGYDAHALPDEGPPHEVTVSPFWILRLEVNTSLLRPCVDAGVCKADDVGTGHGANAGNPHRINHPLNMVTWQGAQDMCRFLGGRLPTEAEWELAARGTDGRAFPWGDEPGCGVGVDDPTQQWSLEMLKGPCVNDSTKESPNLRGESPYGLLGMGGNVWEWVGDWYEDGGYAKAGAVDPTGPAEGTLKVQRGGGWTDEDPWELRAAARLAVPPDARLMDAGFRCVWVPASRR